MKATLKIFGSILFPVIMLSLLALIMQFSGVIFTYTGSVPVGFYRINDGRAKIQCGDYMFFCLPDNIAKIGIERGYIHTGTCKNGSEELVKEVIAVPGDTVRLSNTGILVGVLLNNINYFAPSHVIDKNNLLVRRFIKNGLYPVQGYWVYGNGNPQYSWDSRYYGEIPPQNAQHRLVPLLTFSK